MLKEGWHMSPNEGQEEFEEVQEDLKRKEHLEDDPESGSGDRKRKLDGPVGFLRSILFLLVSKVFLQALTMTFLAEWGDRSQLATIVLAARSPSYKTFHGRNLRFFIIS
jgi:putative Ca2+/H+ antiporter (TMEM165/GDT1 family)